MQAAARRYGWILLVLGLLFAPLPLERSPAAIPAGASPQPFLTQAVAALRAVRALSALGGATPVASKPLPPDPEVVPVAARDPEPASPAPTTVTVREGQSLWAIADQYGTTVDALVAANGLQNPDLIRSGTQLVIPGVVGRAAPAPRRPAARPGPGTRLVAVRISEGQTLWDVSRAYGTSVEEIVAANGLSSPDFVRAGQRLLVPVPAAAVTPRRVATAIAESASSVASSAIALAQGFIWPARGRVTSAFGWRRWRHHDGIDIAAPYGTPVTAARDGVVIFAGWYYAYGKAVIVDHGDGLQTLYGHNSRLRVRVGQRVRKGDVIANVGSTGNSTGPHLHFEVRINGRAVNPMKYL